MLTYPDSGFEYTFRYRVHYLGTVSVHFDENTDNNAYCLCSRVLIKCDQNLRVPEGKNGSKKIVNVLPQPVSSDEQSKFKTLTNESEIRKNIQIENNINSNSRDFLTTNVNDRQRTESDAEAETSCCCYWNCSSIGKMLRYICKKLKRNKRDECLTSENNMKVPLMSGEAVEENENAISTANDFSSFEKVDDDSPVELSSKLCDNGITRMGYAYDCTKLAEQPQISWNYDESRVGKWNKKLLLQMSSNCTKIIRSAAHIAAGDEFPCHTSSVLRPESTAVKLKSDIQPGKNRKRNCSTKEKSKRLKIEILPPEIEGDPSMQKYWSNRYRLFSKFDEGIKLDSESWYSVTPEKISKHIADRCRCDVIVDGFCGAGGNTIQFAFTCERVIAIDIDPKKIELAKHNAKVYGVEDRIEFIVGDFFEVVPSLKADVIFLSPPWGGPSYNNRKVFQLNDLCLPQGGKSIFDIARDVTEDIAYYLPRNINANDIYALMSPGERVEMEQNILSYKLVAITAYFGELVDESIAPF